MATLGRTAWGPPRGLWRKGGRLGCCGSSGTGLELVDLRVSY